MCIVCTLNFIKRDYYLSFIKNACFFWFGSICRVVFTKQRNKDILISHWSIFFGSRIYKKSGMAGAELGRNMHLFHSKVSTDKQKVQPMLFVPLTNIRLFFFNFSILDVSYIEKKKVSLLYVFFSIPYTERIFKTQVFSLSLYVI